MIRRSRSEVRGQKSEIRGQKSEIRARSEIGDQGFGYKQF
jgi:UDP-3-O-[3-hydroxymyristoyl] glucosamine N-acyltransferase